MAENTLWRVVCYFKGQRVKDICVLREERDALIEAHRLNLAAISEERDHRYQVEPFILRPSTPGEAACEEFCDQQRAGGVLDWEKIAEAAIGALNGVGVTEAELHAGCEAYKAAGMRNDATYTSTANAFYDAVMQCRKEKEGWQ